MPAAVTTSSSGSSDRHVPGTITRSLREGMA